MTKSKHLTFRCTEEQYRQIKRAARSGSLSVSELILACLGRYSEMAISAQHLKKEAQNFKKPYTWGDYEP